MLVVDFVVIFNGDVVFIDVFVNDVDFDGDVLIILVVGVLDVGEVVIINNEIVYIFIVLVMGEVSFLYDVIDGENIVSLMIIIMN